MSWIRSGGLIRDGRSEVTNDALYSNNNGPEPFIKTDGRLVEKGNIWYNTHTKGGLSGCITGTNSKGVDDDIGRPGANILDNCTGFGDGSFNETYYKNKMLQGGPFADYFKKPIRFFEFSVAANQFKEQACAEYGSVHPIYKLLNKGKLPKELETELEAERNRFINQCILGPDDYPPLGGLAVYGGGVGKEEACHVAYISEVIDENNIWLLQSGWTVPGWTTPVPEGYLVNRYKATRHKENRKNSWWYQQGRFFSGRTCLGFIANPAINNDEISRGPILTEIVQSSPTSIVVNGNKMSKSPVIKGVELYYKWDTGEQEQLEIGKDPLIKTVTADEINKVIKEDGTFSVTIKKPRSAKSVSVIPRNTTDGEARYPGTLMYKKLTESYPCVTIKDSKGKNRTAIPHIYNGSEWEVAVPTIKDGDDWYELYNTDKEKVVQ